MKLHACRHCGSRLRTYTELQEQLKTHPNVCVTCYRVFSNRSILLAHTCKVEEYLCEICQRSYSTQTKLARHKRETSCHHSLPPEAKHQKPTPPIEDLEAPPPPPLVDEYDSELQDVIIQNWGSIRTHTSHGPVQSRYNFRLMTSDIGGLELGVIFSQIKPRRLKLTFLMASFFEIGHRVDTNIIIALVTAVVDTSTNLA